MLDRADLVWNKEIELWLVESGTVPGRARFGFQGRECSLEPVDQGGRLFFVFLDETSGKETYGGGRFLYADRPAGGSVILDFNKAVTPPRAH